jgi:hypothetical protein
MLVIWFRLAYVVLIHCHLRQSGDPFQPRQQMIRRCRHSLHLAKIFHSAIKVPGLSSVHIGQEERARRNVERVSTRCRREGLKKMGCCRLRLAAALKFVHDPIGLYHETRAGKKQLYRRTAGKNTDITKEPPGRSPAFF